MALWAARTVLQIASAGKGAGMRVLVTGAGGTLGLALAPALEQAGHEPVLLDVRGVETEYEFVHCDVRSAQDVRAAASGVDVIVHAAALHGIHLEAHPPRDFYDLNLTGTLNVWQAAVDAGARGVVFSSTMGVYKTHSAPGQGTALSEDVPLRPGDIYGWTKLAGEELCQLYGRTHGIPSVGLRFGMFVPEPFFRYGIRLLYGGVDTHDVVRSVMTSIDALTSGKLTWGSFNVMSAVPFQENDTDQLARDPLPVLDKYFPGASQLLHERGVDSLAPITVYYPMGHAKQVLGFEPTCNFEQWLDELSRRPDERADTSPPWP
jgi:UDP-glucose 4-epimerase